MKKITIQMKKKKVVYQKVAVEKSPYFQNMSLNIY